MTNVLEHSLAAPARVDRSARVIRGVKVLGLVSANTGRTLGLEAREYGQALDQPYRYSLEAMREAIPLYEGIAVNIDHPATGFDASGRRLIQGAGRSTGDRFGRLVNVRVSDGGLVADLEYLSAHPLAEMVVETAERMPEQLALSHHARCEFSLVNGQIVARKIVAVQSVDIIADRPGTTTTLFESSLPSLEPSVTRRTLHELAESFSAADQSTAEPREVAALRLMLHDKIVSPDLAVELTVTEAGDTPAAPVAAAFRTTLQSAASPPDLLVACQQVKDVVEAWQSRLTSPAGGSQECLDVLLQENLRLKARDEARQLIEAAGLPPTEPLLKALTALESQVDRSALLQTLAHPITTRPRSSEPLVSSEPFSRPQGATLAQLLHSR